MPNVEQHVGAALDTIGDHGVLGAILVLSLCLNGVQFWALWSLVKKHASELTRVQDARVADAKAVAENDAKIIATNSQTSAAMALASAGMERKVEQMLAAVGLLPSGQAAIIDAVRRNDEKLDRNGDKMDRLAERVRGGGR